MLTRDATLLLIAVAVVAVVGFGIYEYEHHHHVPHPSPPQPHPFSPLSHPSKLGMRALPGKKIVPHNHTKLIWSEYAPISMCDAKIRSLVRSNVAIGGANYGVDPTDANTPWCFIYGTLGWDDYHLEDDPYMTAYLGPPTV